MTFFPAMANPTRTAIKRPSRSNGPTINTNFREFRRGINCLSMNILVAGMTNRYSIVNIHSQLWKFRERFNMMCIELFPHITAPLAGIIIPRENSNPPECETISINGSVSMQTRSTFPMWGFITTKIFRSVLIRTIPRTKFSPSISSGECNPTPFTNLYRRGISMRPALFRTILRSVRSICMHHKIFPAKNASALNLTKSHDNILTLQHIIPYYCEVEKFTGNTRQLVCGVDT